MANQAPGAKLTTSPSGLLTVSQSSYNYPLVMSPVNTLAVIGDSVTSHWTQDSISLVSTSTYDTKQWGYLAWALNLSKHRLTVVSDQSKASTCVQAGIGSLPAYSFDIQLSAAIASGANHLLMMGGLNDIETLLNGSSTSAQITTVCQGIQAAWKVLVARALQAGMQIWWCTQSPICSIGSVYTAQRQAANMIMNEWIRQYASSVNNSSPRHSITVVDLHSKVVDPASATGNFITNGNSMSNDDHPSNVASYYMGKELARVWSLYVPELPQLPTSNADSYGVLGASTASPWLFDNGLFIANSAGVATGLNAPTLNGSAACTPTVVARLDGAYGNDQRLACTFGADGDFVRVTVPDFKSRISDGDILVAMCEITVESSPVMLKNINLNLNLNCTLGRSSTCMAYDSSQDTSTRLLPEGFTAVYKTKPIQYDKLGTWGPNAMGNLANALVNFQVVGGGSGSANVRISRFGIKKLIVN